MKKISQRLRVAVKEKRGLLILFLTILMVGIVHPLAARETGLFTGYNVAIVIAAYLASRQRGLALAALSFLVVVLFLHYEPQAFSFFGEERALAFRWASLMAWIGLLLLVVSLFVTLRQKQTVPKPEPKSRSFGRPLASSPYDLLQTSFTTAEKFVKRLMPKPPAAGRWPSPFGN